MILDKKLLISLKPNYSDKRVGTNILKFATFSYYHFNIVTPASNSPKDVFEATLFDIERIRHNSGLENVTFTVCPVCEGHLFHEKASIPFDGERSIGMGACACPCGQTIRYVGYGRKGEQIGEYLPGVRYDL